MLLIVAHHYVTSSGLYLEGSPLVNDYGSVKSVVMSLLGAWGKIGINCFVLITGYFLCKSNVTVKKFVKLLFEVMFYRIAIYAIFVLTGYSTFSVKDLIMKLIPISEIGTGFTNAFLIFYLCIPFLNILIKNLTQKQHLYLLLLLGFTYVLLGSVPSLFEVTMNYVSWFSVLYLISSYVRLYPVKLFENTKFWGISALLSVLASAASVLFCMIIGKIIGRSLAYSFVVDSNAILALLTGFSSFMFFKNIKIKYSPFINTVASTCFGVLQIHAGGDVMRQWLWQDFLKVSSAYNTALAPLYAILGVLFVFAFCSAIDLLRIKFIENPFFKLWDRHFEKIALKYKTAEEKIFKKLKIKD